MKVKIKSKKCIICNKIVNNRGYCCGYPVCFDCYLYKLTGEAADVLVSYLDSLGENKLNDQE